MNNLKLGFTGFLILFCFIGNAQDLEFFWDTEDAIVCARVQEDGNQDYVLVGRRYNAANHFSAFILKLDGNFDTTVRFIENEGQDILFDDFIVLPDNKYLVLGTIGADTGDMVRSVSHVLVMKFDENLDILFEKQYELTGDSYYYYNPDIKIMQDDEDRIYVTASFMEEPKPGDFNMLMQLNDNGDTLKTIGFYSNAFTDYGEVNSIMKNNGNINGFYGFSNSFSDLSAMEILEIDTNFNIEYYGVSNYGEELLTFSPRFTSKWLNDSIYLFLNSEKLNSSNDVDIFVAKFNTSHEFVCDPVWIGRPDTSDWVPRYGMDWKDPNNIFICSYQFVYHVPWEVNQIVALIDSDLNLKGMKYYGEDLNFDIFTLCATSDGGAILPIGQHDYNDPYVDSDLIVWKISSDDLITSASETKNPYDSDYLVFPNPGNDALNVQTARKGVKMEMYNVNGRLVLQKQFKDSYLNTVNTQALLPGKYVYKFTDDKGFTETGKWLKTK